MNNIFRRSSTVQNPSKQEAENLQKVVNEQNDKIKRLEKILSSEIKQTKNYKQKLEQHISDAITQMELKKASEKILQDENQELANQIKKQSEENINLKNTVQELEKQIQSLTMQIGRVQKSPKISLSPQTEFIGDFKNKGPGLFDILQQRSPLNTQLNNNPLLRTQFLDLAHNQVQQEDNVFLSQYQLQPVTQFHSQFIQENIDQGFITYLQDLTSKQNQANCRLFESFYIFGFSNDQLKEILKQSPNLSSDYYDPQIQFEFHSNQNGEKQVNKKMLESCCQVFGHQVFEMKSEDKTKQEMILDIIIGLSNEQNLRERFHLFTFNENIQQNFANQELIDKYNPYRQLYGLCNTVDDFLIIDNRMFKYQKTFCFMTYFPIIELFQKLLLNIINQQKIIRNDKLKPEIEFSTIDGFNLIKDNSDTFVQILEILRRIKPQPCYYSKEILLKWHNVNYFKKKHYSKIHFTIPQLMEIPIQSNIWCTSIMLQIFEVREILSIFFLILLEKKIVFVSEKSSKISAAIQYFLYMIRPLRWTSILCYNLLNQGQHMINTLNRDIPMIIGVCLNQGDSNQSQFREALNQISQDLVLVYLDRSSQKIVFQDYQQQCQFLKSYPDTRIFQSLKKYGDPPKNNRIFYELNEEGAKYIQEYLEKLSQIKNHFLAVLPDKAEVVSERNLFNKYMFQNRINQTYQNCCKFINEFIDTKMFNDFALNHYQCE